jgi:FAD-dependent urate hydroxylase
MLNADLPVIVAGAGVAGLTAAAALQRQGVQAVVVERAAQRRSEGGTGLNLWSNAISALAVLGVSDQVVAAGEPIDRVQLWTHKGRKLSETDTGRLGEELGHVSVSLRRALLLELLARASDRVPVTYATGISNYREEPDHIDVELDDGRSLRGRALLGADGLNSTVRQQLLGDGPPAYQGHTVWRGIGPAGGIDPGTSTMVWGPGGLRAGCWRVDASAAAWFVSLNRPPGEHDAPGIRRRLTHMLDGYEHPIVSAVTGTPDDAVLRTDVYARTSAAGWARGRVALLGDAAHAMPTTFGQGGCQAIEDAVVVAHFLATHADTPRALQSYVLRRSPRVEWVRQQVLAKGKFQSWENPILCSVRNLGARHLPQKSSLAGWREMLTFPEVTAGSPPSGASKP